MALTYIPCRDIHQPEYDLWEFVDHVGQACWTMEEDDHRRKVVRDPWTACDLDPIESLRSEDEIIADLESQIAASPGKAAPFILTLLSSDREKLRAFAAQRVRSIPLDPGKRAEIWSRLKDAVQPWLASPDLKCSLTYAKVSLPSLIPVGREGALDMVGDIIQNGPLPLAEACAIGFFTGSSTAGSLELLLDESRLDQLSSTVVARLARQVDEGAGLSAPLLWSLAPVATVRSLGQICGLLEPAFVTPSDMEDAAALSLAKMLVQRWEGQAVKAILGGFQSQEKAHDLIALLSK